MGDFFIIWADVIAHVYHLADIIAFINVVVVGKTLHHLCDLLMADVIAKWQDGTATFLYFKVGRCYCHVARWKATFVLKLADVIARWQML